MKVNIVLPNQLFKHSSLPDDAEKWILVEEHLFFNQYNFHKQKLVFHRSAMLQYQSFLEDKGYAVEYISGSDEASDIRVLMQKRKEDEIHIIDPIDDWVTRRIKESHQKVYFHENPSFITYKVSDYEYFQGKKQYFHHHFYQSQRKRLNILMDSQGNPAGGKWSFDEDNRKKYPRKKQAPSVQVPVLNPHTQKAVASVKSDYESNIGELDTFIYPTNYTDAESWFEQFLDYRFTEFGVYEDAIVGKESILHHSLLSPLINVGLLTPQYVIEKVLERSEEFPMNSVEGFIRQIIGWREFIRGVYELEGRKQRTTNFWGFTRKIPSSFYDGTTGIVPIDQTIQKVLKTGYCHHIERLMVLGNFMMLCEFDPDEVYRWFMELFIDAYDWVMVPNIYGMSQFADGGLMTTKPYLSGSNYIRKMSDYKQGDWCEVWDALYWSFIAKRKDFFKSNYRLSMMVRMWEKKSKEKQEELLGIAENWLEKNT